MDETDRRREKQIAYNTANNMVPTQINKKIDETLTKSAVSSYHYDNAKQVAAEQDLQYLPKEEIEKRIREKRKHMEDAAKELDFIVAAKLRDEIAVLREKL
jgi:excinuclease ABC subunit B